MGTLPLASSAFIWSVNDSSFVVATASFLVVVSACVKLISQIANAAATITKLIANFLLDMLFTSIPIW
ncbi:MAG: hypothetical protein IPQ12_10005 [Polaromonas sp.]|nr:hypothetical protein [Polaromonas sp.]